MTSQRGGRTVRPESVRARMSAFFVANEDEELTYEMAREKFNCSASAIEHAITELRKAGILESVHVIRNRKKGIAK